MIVFIQWNYEYKYCIWNVNEFSKQNYEKI